MLSNMEAKHLQVQEILFKVIQFLFTDQLEESFSVMPVGTKTDLLSSPAIEFAVGYWRDA